MHGVAKLQAQSRLDDPDGVGKHQGDDAGLGGRQSVPQRPQRDGMHIPLLLPLRLDRIVAALCVMTQTVETKFNNA